MGHGNTSLRSEVSGTVWQVLVEPGQSVGKDDVVLILEAMKMEIPVLSPCSGTIAELAVVQGDSVTESQLVAIISA